MELTYALSSLATGLLSFILAVIVFLGNPSLKENRAWSLTGLCIAVWAGGLGFAILADNKAESYFWNQIFYLGGVWIPTAFLWFVSVFTKKFISRFFLILSALLSFSLSLILIFKRELFIANLVPKGPFRFWDILGPAYHVFTFYFFSSMIFSLVHLYRAMERDSSISRKKLKWIFIGIFCGVFGGSTNFFYDYNINILPFGQFFIFLYPILVSWAILRHQAIDIGVLFKKTGLLLGIYLLLIAATIPIIIFIWKHMEILQVSPTVSFCVAVLLTGGIFSLGPFTYAYISGRGRFFREQTMSGLTHELKSPLAIIESALDAMQNPLPGNSEALVQKEYMQMMDRNLSRLRLFVNDLLVVFGNKQAELQLNREEVVIESLVHKAVELHADAAKKKSIVFDIQLTNEIKVIVGDTQKIIQVLSNLVSNALKFTDSGQIKIRVEQSVSAVLFAVADTGQGIQSQDLTHVFDRFYQGQQQNRNQGTGIGLTISKIWVEAHGGKIWAESLGEGKGTTVKFTIPL